MKQISVLLSSVLNGYSNSGYSNSYTKVGINLNIFVFNLLTSMKIFIVLN